jgi:hypothetical protein
MTKINPASAIEDWGVDVERRAEEVRRVAEQDPYHESEHQSYVIERPGPVDTKLVPCCIVGHALHNLGVPVEQLRAWDERNEGGCSVANIIRASFAGPMLTWLSDVQDAQDNEHPWAEAVAIADDPGPEED